MTKGPISRTPDTTVENVLVKLIYYVPRRLVSRSLLHLTIYLELAIFRVSFESRLTRRVEYSPPISSSVVESRKWEKNTLAPTFSSSRS